MSQNEMKITLTGPWAIVALVTIAGLIFFQTNVQNKTLDSEAIEVLKTWLIAEYTHNVLPQLEEMIQNPSGKEKQIRQIVSQITRGNVQIVSIESRGSGDNIAVKAEIKVNGNDPPFGKRIRYFRMTHSVVTGWLYEHEIGKWGYYLTF